MSLSRVPSFDTFNGVYYPSSDGKPMAETGIHVLAIMALYQALDEFLKGRPDFYVAANMFWYWEEGNPRARHSPDVMVIRGVDKTIRRSFVSWREHGAVPCVIFDAKTGTPILTPAERAKHEQERAEREQQRAEKAEAENERLKQLRASLAQQKNGGSTPA